MKGILRSFLVYFYFLDLFFSFLCRFNKGTTMKPFWKKIDFTKSFRRLCWVLWFAADQVMYLLRSQLFSLSSTAARCSTPHGSCTWWADAPQKGLMPHGNGLSLSERREWIPLSIPNLMALRCDSNIYLQCTVEVRQLTFKLCAVLNVLVGMLNLSTWELCFHYHLFTIFYHFLTNIYDIYQIKD